MNKAGLAVTLAVHGLVLLLALSGQHRPSKAEAAVLTTRLIPAPATPAPTLMPTQLEPGLPMPALPAPLPAPEFQISASAEPAGLQVAPPAVALAAMSVAVAVTTAPAATPANAEPAPPSSRYQPASLPPEHGSCSARGVERHYPALLRERGVQGQVLLRVQVNEQGRAAEVLVQGGSGWRLLDEAARQIALACPYLPARRGEQRLAAWVEYPIRFALH
ncbi:energy transducer TonB [Pelomonas sp. V22]|uniref:energy transducer TonB n=1 Tax=Pelomonas sp. V22 TaxID=2822139 RepID=UPI0024A90DE0|nr:energy transducer TonB [Pelomonas sp. V22]